jgi:ATP-independent RNA helicase DbpA
VTAGEFESLELPAGLLEGLRTLELTQMLPVQAQALPAILAGRDVLVQSPTGSGKTIAFALGMLAKVEPRLDVQALAICPTRELCEQVSGELRRLARRIPNLKVLSLYGGVPFAPQRNSLRQGAHIVVGTPGRLDEHVRKSSLSLTHVKVLVLDEADRMLDMGFEPQIERVVRHAPAARQTLLLSATYPDSIAGLCRKYQRDVTKIVVTAPPQGEALADGSPGGVEELFFDAPSAKRIGLLANWLDHERPPSALVFCNTRVECNDSSEELRRRGWVAASIHGEMAQRERQHVMRLFANGSCSVLTATDVAARGWDIAELPVVVNLGLSRDPTVHLHRAGRTGRVGRAGRVVSFVSEADDDALSALERRRGAAVVFERLPARGPAVKPPRPSHVTLLLGAGKDKKLRPGDILGALTGEGGVAGDAVGSIVIDANTSYVAVAAASAERALAKLEADGIKGRRVKARIADLSLRSE